MPSADAQSGIGSRIPVLQVVSAPSHVTGQTAGITGPERRAANLAGLWADHGIDITVLYPRRGALWDRFAEVSVPMRDFEIQGKSDFGAIARLTQAIRDSGACVIHSQGAAALDMMVVAASRRAGIPAVVTRPVMIDDLTNRAALNRRIFAAIDRRFTLTRADAVVAVSRDGHTRLKPDVPADRLHLIHNGTLSPVDGRAPLPRTDDTVHLGMIGHLRDYKGFDDFLNVARVLVAERPNLHFHIVGEGPERANLEHMRDDFGLSEYVTFHGLLQDVAPVLQRLDIFLFTSWREGLSVAILEAMSASLPIVATDIGGIADQIDEGLNGHIVPAHDIQGLATQCGRLIDDADMRTAMGGASRRLFEERFAQSSMLSNYVALYRRVARI